MFYRPEDGHGLPHNPIGAVVAPRPIAWISTRGTMGDNLAPYSFFNLVAYDPPQVIFSGDPSDTVTNALETGVFAVNIVEEAALAAMNATSAGYPRGVDEFTACGVAKAECQTIPCPRVAGAPATLECRVLSGTRLKGDNNTLVLGEVVGIHLRDDCLVGGRFDVTRFHPMGRLGYRDYVAVNELIEMKRPG